MRSFSEVIREEVDNKKPYRLVVIAERRMVKKAKKNSDKPVVKKPSSTSSKLYNLAKEAGCKVYSVKVNGAYLERDDKGIITIHNQDDEKGFEMDGDTIVMVRGAVTAKDSYLDLISQIERYGFPVVNSRECIEVCADKFRTYLRLQEIGMNQPRTVLIPNEEPETVDMAAKRLDNEFPMVLKTLQGAKGVGVLLVETERSLQSTVSLVYKIDPTCDILLQEYIESDYERLRMYRELASLYSIKELENFVLKIRAMYGELDFGANNLDNYAYLNKYIKNIDYLYHDLPSYNKFISDFIIKNNINTFIFFIIPK